MRRFGGMLGCLQCASALQCANGANAGFLGHASVDGEWVVGREQLPRYSQSTCPMLQSFEHTHDVNAADVEYEFKTAGCELPAWDLATVSKFLTSMAGKTLLFAGDSITGNWWVSFVCMLHQLVPSVEHDQDMHSGTVFDAHARFLGPDGESSTRIGFWRLSGYFRRDVHALSRCIHGHGRMLKVWGVPQDGILNASTAVRVKPDVLIVNQGVWYNNEPTEAAALRKGFHEAISVPLMQRNTTQPVLIWRETAPQRFNTPGGLFHTFQKVDRWRNVSCELRPVAELHRHNWRNTALKPEFATLGRRIRTLPIFDLSARYPKVDQPKAKDCTHFALPGLPDTWSHLLLATLL